MSVNQSHIPLPSQLLPTARSSEVKNSFASVLEKVRDKGPIAITRHGSPAAVLLSAAEWESLVALLKTADPLNKYRAEYDLRFASLQEDGVEEKFEKMLSASSEELGAAAVKHAKDFP